MAKIIFMRHSIFFILSVGVIKGLSDPALLDVIQRQTFSRHTFGEEACAIGGNYRSRPIWRLFRNIPDIRIVLEKVGFQSPSINQ
jgi:hypothetical protein